MRTLETERLTLRHWRLEDAEALYEYAKDPRIGPPCGWQPHTSVEDSLHVIKTVLIKEETYAVTLREGGGIAGCASLFKTKATPERDDLELGYWMGVPHWGRGYIPEASRALLRRAFTELGQERVWCAHFAGNDKSRRVIEKCGFLPEFDRDEYVALLDETRHGYYYSMSRADWERISEK